MSLLHWKTFCWIFLFQTTFAGGIDNNNPSFPSSSSSTSVSITIPTEDNQLVNGRLLSYGRRLDAGKPKFYSYVRIRSGLCEQTENSNVRGRETITTKAACLSFVYSIGHTFDKDKDGYVVTQHTSDLPYGCYQLTAGKVWSFNTKQTSNKECVAAKYGYVKGVFKKKKMV